MVDYEVGYGIAAVVVQNSSVKNAIWNGEVRHIRRYQIIVSAREYAIFKSAVANISLDGPELTIMKLQIWNTGDV